MSPNVGNFVHDLVEMAKAMETLPLVRAELDRANTQIEDYAKSVQRLEIKLIDRNNEIDALHATIRALEVSRDDAELRFLELDEKAHKAMGDLEAVQTLVQASMRELSPPKPEPAAMDIANEALTHVAEQMPEPEHFPEAYPKGWDDQPLVPEGQHVEGNQGPSESPPSVSSSMDAQSPIASTAGPQDTAPITTSAGEGQSAADPTASSQEPQSPPVTTSTVDEAVAASPSSPVADPEPFIKFSNEWYDWEARQWRQNHKAAE